MGWLAEYLEVLYTVWTVILLTVLLLLLGYTIRRCHA